MKIEITLKDPDCVYDAINEALETLKIEGLNEEELEAVKEKRREEYQEICSKWFEYGEYLTVRLDTQEKTLEILENNN